MNIIEKSKADLNMHELYALTMTPEAMKLSGQVGEVIEFSMWAVYEDENADGEMQTLLSLVTPEGETYTTNSRTFRDEFMKIVTLSETIGEDFNKVKVVGGVSKNNREYITPALA